MLQLLLWYEFSQSHRTKWDLLRTLRRDNEMKNPAESGNKRNIQQMFLLSPEECPHNGRSTDFASSSAGAFPKALAFSGICLFRQLHGCWDSPGFSPDSLLSFACTVMFCSIVKIIIVIYKVKFKYVRKNIKGDSR